MMAIVICLKKLPWVLLAMVFLAPVWGRAKASSDASPGPGAVQQLLERAGNRKLATSERRAAAAKALAEARARGDLHSEAEAEYALAQVEWDTEDLGPALEQCRIARRLFQRAGDDEGALKALRRSGDILYRFGDYKDAMETYVKALHEAEALAARVPDRQHRLNLAHIHVTMGNVLRRTGDRDQALAEYQTALRIYRAEQYKLGCAGLQLNMGNLLADQGRHKEALSLYKDAERAGVQLGNTQLVAIALTSMASSNVQLGRLSTARTLLRRSFALCSESGNTRGTMHNEVVMGDLLAAGGRPKAALRRYETALKMAETLHDQAKAAEIHGLMAGVFHTLGENAQAYEHLVMQRELSRKILDAEEAARISGLRTAYAAQRREAQIALLQQREASERARSWLLGLGLGSVVIVLLIIITGLLLRARGHRLILRQKRELEQAYVRMEELSRTDALTGLPNRRDAVLRLTAEIARSQRSGETFGLGITDIDGFKQVNDRLGHQTGDRVLTAVAKALRTCLREPDYVARWGGDEFLLIISTVDADGLQTASERMHAAVAEAELPPLGDGCRLTISCGFVLCSGGDADAWLQRADEALYRAKKKGRNVSEIVPCKPV